MVRTTKIYTIKKAVLLSLLLEPEDIPENIGEIRDRNKQSRHGARKYRSLFEDICIYKGKLGKGS